MPEPIVPTIDELGERRFSFYPAILNVEHNEWVVRELKWSEILVGNCKSGDEVWVPRRYVGEVASTEMRFWHCLQRILTDVFPTSLSSEMT